MNARAASLQPDSTQEEQSVFCFEVCNLHEAQVPRLYILEHTDGAGHRMMLGIAVCSRRAVFLRG